MTGFMAGRAMMAYWEGRAAMQLICVLAGVEMTSFQAETVMMASLPAREMTSWTGEKG